MTEYEALVTAICGSPEDDTPRLALANHIRTSDPERALFIEDQIAEAARRRAQRDYLYPEIHPLLRKNDHAWSRLIAKYARRWVYDRGFITAITIDPYLFLEYGSWLFVNAPIRMVTFTQPQALFPMAELAESPLLEGLDAIEFDDPRVTRADLAIFSQCSFLKRLLYLSSCELDVDDETYECFAAANETRKVLRLLFSQRNFPGELLEHTDEYDYWGARRTAWRDLTPVGNRLEIKYGYIPWLHRRDNRAVFDAAWFVARGILPVKPAGSPVH